MRPPHRPSPTRAPHGAALLAAALAVLLAGAPCGAQSAAPAHLVVRVIDQASGRPVRDVRVEVGGVARQGRTGADGTASFDAVPPGNRIVQLSRLGYAPDRVALEFAAGAAVEHTFTLRAEAVAVRGVEGRAARRDPSLDARGFYRRRQSGAGAFLDGERIFDLRPRSTLELFRRMRGFAINYDRRGNPFLVTTRGTNGLGQPCPTPLVFVDGALVTNRAATAAEAVDLVPPENIAGIEAFAGPASIPAEYNITGAACGVVLIWTRSGPG